MATTSFISARRVHSGLAWLPEGTVLEVAHDGLIHAIHDPGVVSEDIVHHYPGMLCPGFINAHCHLELSHLRSRIDEGGGLLAFVGAVMRLRHSFSDMEKQVALRQAISELKSNGIVAVGDIANSNVTLGYRRNAGLHIHTFVEAMGFPEEISDARFQAAYQIWQSFEGESRHVDGCLLRQSIVPHAPYSVSENLFARIDGFMPFSLLSIHNQESNAENEWFARKEGALRSFYDQMQLSTGHFVANGKTSVQTFLPRISCDHPLLLVHNTYTTAGDLELLRQRDNVFLCLCPNANWYIERRLPDLILLQQSGLPLCLGTDSLASNHELSIWAEVQRIRDRFPEIALGKLLRWACYNGALALQMTDRVGSFSPGLRPGVLHLDSADVARPQVLY